MPHCFVMQPFDGGAYDSRFEYVFEPAIAAVGLEAYRVDRDPSVSIPIQEIENGIKDARVCLAEITEDNPNVWFELGYAIAIGREVILICSDQRKTKFPFDVQHRAIIRYSTGSIRDFEALRINIVNRLTAILQKPQALAETTSTALIKNIEGLSPAEILALAAVGENLPDGGEFAPSYTIHNDIKSAGYTQLAAKLALQRLEQLGFIGGKYYLTQYSEDETSGYTLTDKGWEWIMSNSERFVLKKTNGSRPTDYDNDLPF